MNTKLATSRFFIPVIASILMLAPISARAEEGLKVATVDMQALFKDYHRTNEAQKQINVERARIQKENNDRLEAIRSLNKELSQLGEQLNDPAISEVKKQGLNQQLQSKSQQSMALEKERTDFLARRNQALNEKMVTRMKNLLGEIREKVEARARAEGYNLLLDKSGLSTSQVPFVLFSDLKDLTSEMQRELGK